MKRFFYLFTILCTLFALMPIVALAQERGLATDSMKAKQFVKTLGKDARVLLFLPTSSPKNVFYTVKNDIKYYNVETEKVNDVQFIDSISHDGTYYHDSIMVGSINKSRDFQNYYKPIILAGDSNLVVITQSTTTCIKKKYILEENYNVFKFSPRNMRFVVLGTSEKEITDYDFKGNESRFNVSYKNKSFTITRFPTGWDFGDIFDSEPNPYDYVIGKLFTHIFDFDGNLLSKTSKDYTIKDYFVRQQKNKADFKKYYSPQPQRKATPQRRKPTSKRPVKR